MTAMHQLILATRAENADLRGGGWPCSGDHWNMQLRIHPWLAAWGWDFRRDFMRFLVDGCTNKNIDGIKVGQRG